MFDDVGAAVRAERTGQRGIRAKAADGFGERFRIFGSDGNAAPRLLI